MNSNLIREGEFYAWYPDRPKGRFVTGASKIVVKRIYKSKGMYDKNRRTDVGITIIEPGPNVARWYQEGRTMTVPAREIIDYWDSYKDEEAVILNERERADYERRKQQVQRTVMETIIGAKLAEKGFPHGVVSVSSDWVTLPLTAVVDWLGVSETELNAAFTAALGPPIDSDTPGYETPRY